MTKVMIIGGGASGLVAAIQAKKSGQDVILLERNDTIGKKLLITGNGRCNYWNKNIDCQHYHSKNKEILEEIITESNKKLVMEFFDQIGVIPKIKNEYYYPYSLQAVSIKAALYNEMEALNIQVITNSFVTKIEKINQQFFVYTTNSKYIVDRVILATGSKAYPKTGSDGNGYILATSLNHHISDIYPALTQVYGDQAYYKEWNGIRMDAKLSLYEEDNLVKEEMGELHLTDYGLSGICIFNLSGRIAEGLAKKKKEEVVINFLPDLDFQDEFDLTNWLTKRNDQLKKRSIDQLFDGFLPYKLVYLFLHLLDIKPNQTWSSLSRDQQVDFARLILSHKVNIQNTSDFSKAQVCRGGVFLSEIDPHTMESLIVKDLYLVGEVLDVDGECGGYNLGFAWISGLLAGKSVGEKSD